MGGIPQNGAGGARLPPLRHTLRTRTSAYDKPNQP